MRLSRFALLGLSLAVMAGCRESDNPITPVIPDLAYVRYINAVPDTMNTTFRFIDNVAYVPLTFVNVKYRELASGGYQGVRLDAHKIRVFTADVANYTTAGNTSILVDTTLTFEKGKYYTILHTGYARAGSSPKQRLLVIEDALPTPGANVALRFINAGVNTRAFDFYTLASATTPVTGAPAAPALAPGGISTYTTRTPAAFATVVTATGSTATVASAVAPVGVAGNPFSPASNGVAAIDAVDPISGSKIPGSVMTAIAFPASVAGSMAATAASPSVVYYLDKQPPRFSTP